MSVLVVGLSHHTAPMSLLEQVTLPADAAEKLLIDVVSGEHAGEALVLSTCNRVEVYADVDKFHGGLAHASEMLARRTGVDLESLTPHLYVHYEDRAVAHLFSVACGLDSMVVGESQILGQVRGALRAAQDAGTAGRTLGALAQQALRVGKRARTETGIDRASRSLVTAGVEQATTVLGPLRDRPALVVGAGAMSALAASVLAQVGAAPLLVANRTLATAERVASTAGGRGVRLDDVAGALEQADIVVSCTGALGQVVSAEVVAQAQRVRSGRPLVLVDLALPRDVEPGTETIPGVTVIDLESLATVLERTQHAADVEAIRLIVADEVVGFLGWQRAASVAPTVVALREMAGAVVRAELGRLQPRLPGLDERSRAEIEQTVRRVVDKVLHAPTVRVKQLAGEPGGQAYAEALTRLFGLDPATVDAVTRPDLAADAGAGASAEADTGAADDADADAVGQDLR